MTDLPELEFDTWGCGDEHACRVAALPPCENCGGTRVVTIFELPCPDCNPVHEEA